MSLHLVPAGDRDRHELHIGCPCAPRVEIGGRPDGTFGLIVDHSDRSSTEDQCEE